MAVATKTCSIREASELSGLAASTLRYYEQIGIIQPIGRDAGGVAATARRTWT
ncbi:MerR family DNA-binding transcriptional regulator [Sinomonas terrae]|uniref:MerR family DNA-binding transcriptional regulator n=1 Tax=Sinomonas terrae TaxID=2908838 RepID=A0ABS9U2E1_9MICC|nr:MerR family DNA-binding transcriptional regulator [Sinomonas terrae]MCH6470760.1 MerR family DNA-binding transcriptional regulator [Sinomonas terrae]